MLLLRLRNGVRCVAGSPASKYRMYSSANSAIQSPHAPYKSESGIGPNVRVCSRKFIPICCVTASPAICSSPPGTCEPCRNYWAMLIYRPLKSTLTSIFSISPRFMTRLTQEQRKSSKTRCRSSLLGTVNCQPGAEQNVCPPSIQRKRPRTRSICNRCECRSANKPARQWPR